VIERSHATSGQVRTGSMSEAKYDASADSPSCSGMSWSSSNVCAGFVVQVFGYQIGFVTLAAIAVGGLVFFALFMPETSPKESTRLEVSQGDTPSRSSVEDAQADDSIGPDSPARQRLDLRATSSFPADP